jgi:3-dehydrosphinganine reductase
MHALITGGSMGIGLAAARQLVRQGAGVTLAARRRGPLEQAAQGLSREHAGARVRILELDVSDQEAVERRVRAEIAEQPSDLVLNCAGIAHAGRFLESAPQDFRAQVDTNYLGTVWVLRAVLPPMIERGSGHVVNVGSIAAIEGVYGYSAYSPSKFAVSGLSQVLRAELRPHGVKVSILQPPNTDTAQLEAERASAPAEMRRINETSRVMSPDAVAESLLRGVARGRFEIIPGLDSRAMARFHRLSPVPLRAYFDWHVRRALATRDKQ